VMADESRKPQATALATELYWWMKNHDESWPGKSAQCDKWNFCLKAARIAAEQEQR
jgi:hypothetical protein